ncbi:endonuclease/exonuclease/phosphatase family protein [Chitinophaga vietnamensis]|uniref:endonuclease/exonuclease/phosphatase family protein n=1 Tax=Chitinophaga vietnamensis TaxID=2593957 RepID=UPI001177CD49|nr:endonuclease/exonuclease/phosphatase family protein [Chitinophaga vietnamensis]
MLVFIRSLFLWSNVLLALLLSASAFLTFLNPGQYWIAGFAGMFFPPLFLLALLFIPLWVLYKKKYYLISLAATLLCAGPALHTWGIHFFQRNDVQQKADSSQFTLMTYNTSSMGLLHYQDVAPVRNQVYAAVRAASPDVLCLQEFYTNDNPALANNIDSIRLAGDYPWHYFTCDKSHWDTWHYGIILFSRYPVVKAEKVACGFSAAGSGSSFLLADLRIGADTIRVISGQLTSYMFTRSDFKELYTLRRQGITDTGGFTALLMKMRHTFSQRAAQARQLAALATASPYPVIVCGDFNDTPVSFTYRTVSAHLQDAFLQRCAGWGRTLSYLSPTLRIDYILPQERFYVHACQVLKVPRSEHFPVMARLSLKKH